MSDDNNKTEAKTLLEQAKETLVTAAETAMEYATDLKNKVIGETPSEEDEAADKVKDAADSTADKVKHAAHDTADKVKNVAHETAEKAKGAAHDATEKVKNATDNKEDDTEDKAHENKTYAAAASSEEPEMKGNHLPAEKMSGGVRIARKKRPSESEKQHEKHEKSESTTDSNKKEEDSSGKEESTSTELQGASKIMADKLEENHHEESVRSYHEKPMPTKQPDHTYANSQAHKDKLFQPRKQ